MRQAHAAHVRRMVGERVGDVGYEDITLKPDFDTAWMHGREFPRHNKEHTAEAGTGRVSRDSGELKDRRGLWNL